MVLILASIGHPFRSTDMRKRESGPESKSLYSRAEPASVVAEWVRKLMPRACHDVVCVPLWVDEPWKSRKLFVCR